MVSVNGSDKLLAILNKTMSQFAMDVGFEKGTEFEFFVKGDGQVHINGYMGPNDNGVSKTYKQLYNPFVSFDF